MKQAYSILALNDIIHVELDANFQISLCSMLTLWPQILSACACGNSRRVLIEGQQPIHAMSSGDAFAHGDYVSGLHRPGLRVALCFYDYSPDESLAPMLQFPEGKNCTLRLFTELDPALRWLSA